MNGICTDIKYICRYLLQKYKYAIKSLENIDIVDNANILMHISRKIDMTRTDRYVRTS